MITANEVLDLINELQQDGSTGALRGPYVAAPGTTGKQMTASDLVTKVVGQTQGRVQGQQMLIRIAKESALWIEQDVPIDGLIGLDDPDLNKNHVARSKGSIVVTGDGEILDGRHRTYDARKRGMTTISAYVPVGIVKETAMFGIEWERPLFVNVVYILTNSWAIFVCLMALAWWGIASEHWQLGDPATSSIVSGGMGWLGLVIGMARQLGSDTSAGSNKWLPNLLFCVTITTISVLSLVLLAAYALAIDRVAMEETIHAVLIGGAWSIAGSQLGLAMNLTPTNKGDDKPPANSALAK